MCYQVSVGSKMISDIVARATRDACVRRYVGGFNLCHVCFWSLPSHTHPFESTGKTSLEKTCTCPGERKQEISGWFTIFTRSAHCRQWTFLPSFGRWGVRMNSTRHTSPGEDCLHGKLKNFSSSSSQNICKQFYSTEDGTI